MQNKTKYILTISHQYKITLKIVRLQINPEQKKKVKPSFETPRRYLQLRSHQDLKPPVRTGAGRRRTTPRAAARAPPSRGRTVCLQPWYSSQLLVPPGNGKIKYSFSKLDAGPNPKRQAGSLYSPPKLKILPNL